MAELFFNALEPSFIQNGRHCIKGKGIVPYELLQHYIE